GPWSRTRAEILKTRESLPDSHGTRWPRSRAVRSCQCIVSTLAACRSCLPISTLELPGADPPPSTQHGHLIDPVPSGLQLKERAMPKLLSAQFAWTTTA